MKLLGRDQKIVYSAVYESKEPITIYELTCKIEDISYNLIRYTVQTLVERGLLEYVDGKVTTISPIDAGFGLAPEIPNQFKGNEIVYKRS